jgi:hypothetical protein
MPGRDTGPFFFEIQRFLDQESRVAKAINVRQCCTSGRNSLTCQTRFTLLDPPPDKIHRLRLT